MESIIISNDNTIIKLYRKLASSKKERYALNKYVLEGARLVDDAIKEGANLSHLLVTEFAVDKNRGVLSQVDLKKVRLIIISNELGIKISATEKTQGIFAICDMPNKLPLAETLNKGGKYVILHKLQDPGNVGMIIRSADAIGIDGVILSESCDLFSPKVIRSTMGSVFRLPIWWDMNIDEILSTVKEQGIGTFAAVVDNDAYNIKDYKFDDNCVVLIGNEGNGLDLDIIQKCDKSITIKMNGNINSLNAAMAAGIIMWELMN